MAKLIGLRAHLWGWRFPLGNPGSVTALQKGHEIHYEFAIVNINTNVNINLDRRILKLQQVPQCRGDAFPSHSQRFSLRTKREAGS